MRLRNILVCLVLAIIIVAGLNLLRPAISGEPDKPADTSDEAYYSLEIQQAVHRGLRFLASRQRKNGLWTESEYPLVVSAVSGLALLQSGSLPDRGPYSEAVAKLLNYYLKHQPRRTGFITTDDPRPANGHAFSLLFLIQVYGLNPQRCDERLKKLIQKSTNYIITHQESAGQWSQDFAHGTHGEVTTIFQLQALRAAKDAGFNVPKKTIAKAVKYMKRLIERKGYCRCSAPCQGPLASGIASLMAGGIYDHKQLQPFVDDLWNNMNYKLDNYPFPMYTHLYASHVFCFWGQSRWDKYYKNIKDYLLKHQKKDGSWTWRSFQHQHAFRPGPAWGTATCCIILQLPNKHLPFIPLE